MGIIDKLLTGYPAGDVSGQDFVDHLSIGAPGWEGAWGAIALAVVFGLLVYIIPLWLVEREKCGPYPLWLHTFYCAADFMGIWVFLAAWGNYDHFLLFLLLAIGEAVWVALVSFNPWCNMWLAISPEFFSLKANPWYYLMGVVCLFFAIRGCVVYKRLPEKPQVKK